MNLFETIEYIISKSFNQVVDFIPNIIGGIIILLIGVVLSQLIRKLAVSFFSFIRLGNVLSDAGISKKDSIHVWENIFIEILGWAVLIAFLIPTAEIWGLSGIGLVLNKIVTYIPNVLIAVIIGFVGVVVSKLAHDIVRHSIKSVGSTSATTLAVFAKYAILFFTGLVVLNQLGVAQDLIRILFTGIVAMIAIAGGLAFGLGGQESAKEILSEIKKSLK